MPPSSGLDGLIYGLVCAYSHAVPSDRPFIQRLAQNAVRGELFVSDDVTIDPLLPPAGRTTVASLSTLTTTRTDVGRESTEET